MTLSQQFAVSKFELTFDEWDTCADYGDCPRGISDMGWGRGQLPAADVNWEDAQRYIAWISKMTGKRYRLLTEAEYEYAARAGTASVYPWGDDLGTNKANCNNCGSRWDNTQDGPVGSFDPNGFGLYDMVGNVFEWGQDCYHPAYGDAPSDGSEWTAECPDPDLRVIRGGGKNSFPRFIRSASRRGAPSSARRASLGFRIARTLSP